MENLENLTPFPDDPDLHDTPPETGGDTEQPAETDPAGDTEPGAETPPDDTGGDTEPDGETPQDGAGDDENDDTDLALLEKYGLSGQYATLDSALEAMAHKETAITSTQRENAQLRKLVADIVAGNVRPNMQQQAEPEPEVAAEDWIEQFQDDPLGTFERMAKQLGYVAKSDVEPLSKRVDSVESTARTTSIVNALDNLEGLSDVAQFVKKHGVSPETPVFPAGKNRVWDAMNDVARKHPDLFKTGFVNALPILHELAMAKVGAGAGNGSSGAAATRVTTVPADRKAAARTTTSAASSRSTETPDFSDPKWTPEKMRQWYERNGGQFPG